MEVTIEPVLGYVRITGITAGENLWSDVASLHGFASALALVISAHEQEGWIVEPPVVDFATKSVVLRCGEQSLQPVGEHMMGLATNMDDLLAMVRARRPAFRPGEQR